MFRILWTITAATVCSGAVAQEFVTGEFGAGEGPFAMPAAAWSANEIPAPIVPAPAVVPPERAERLVESAWSGRIDYFHWNERLDGRDFVNEDGPLVTLSYVRRVGPERFRAELFGGSVGYGAEIEYHDGTTEPLSSHTNYMGLRGEYDLVYDPDWWPVASLLAGVGTRFWFRDLPDTATASGERIWGYQETWWTVFPYVGLETRGAPEACDLEFFGSARIGATAVTYEHVSWDDVTLYPKLGAMGQLELGLRGPRLFLSGYFEAMTWGASDVVRDCWQPRSAMITVGLRSGFRF